uniref:GABA type A receptor associated protein like 2 n=1 Tax=Sus scrofa TaxID=9823 RepID=A0A8D0YMM3_PIG
MKWMFKEDHSLEHRCVESAKIRAKYPDRVPVIVEKVSGSQIVDIDKRKYLVPSDITVAQFMWIIRKRIQLPSEKAIFLFVDKTVPQSSMQKFQGQGLNLCHGCDLRHRNDNIGSLTCCTTKRIPPMERNVCTLESEYKCIYLFTWKLFLSFNNLLLQWDFF